MIVTWMLAATALGTIMILAAMALEKASRLLGRQGRWAWLLALGVTTSWPLAAPFVLSAPEAAVEQRVLSSGPVAPTSAGVSAPSRVASVRAALGRLDGPLTYLWATATVLLLLRAAYAFRALHRLTRRAEHREVDGQAVLISQTAGPAAFGVVRPRVVLPSWALELDEPTRAMVLRHELEHISAADPALLSAAWIAAALMPWNVALWVIARRLRTATELDCDLRVVRQGVDARHYAQLLLLMSQRQGPASFAALIAGSPSTLHQRITAMHADRPRNPRLRAAALIAIALVGSTAAASPALANELASVRDRIASAPSFQEPSRRTVTRRAPSDSAKRAIEDSIAKRARTEPLKRDEDVTSLRRIDEIERREVESAAVLERRRAERRASERESREALLQRRAEMERENASRLEVLDQSRSERAREAAAARANLQTERAAQERASSRMRDELIRTERELGETELARREIEARAQRETELRAERGTREQEPSGWVARDTQVVFAPGGSPVLRYPDILHQAGVQGVVVAQIVVDTSGLPITSSLKIVRKSHDLFESSLRSAVPQMRFISATVGDRKVRQLIQLVYLFRIDGAPRETPVDVGAHLRTLEVTVTARQ